MNVYIQDDEGKILKTFDKLPFVPRVGETITVPDEYTRFLQETKLLNYEVTHVTMLIETNRRNGIYLTVKQD